jgi:hypothetical protein
MSSHVYRYDFEPIVASEEVEASLLLALIGAEALHGETATRLGVTHFFDAEKRICVVDAGSDVGHDFNSLFAGFLRREFGAEAFRVFRVNSNDTALAANT